ncbi:centriolar satellite-associated tubulin polyglutamylase complex regulator 1 isoform X3 [Equus quagga]|uniref:centriolar satellite-associated tubulin polyglutamylase complex regulator 1 isoform X3 n=1 Tax=Equus quagga TaxID=89248 RepID=UPI001D04D912|nr:UPF0705 protein C11orf49 homolog isoform X3 [Equus asinus]XP_046500660.1 centriolar satellite-associated tubulin polyglutamylase complex regulator 1 isoform X3 [Equus quagga]
MAGDSPAGRRCSCSLQSGRVASDVPPAPAALHHLLTFPAWPPKACEFAAIAGTSWSVYNHLKDLLTMKEYHCLLQLLCPDFPLELTQKAARIVLMDDAMDCLMSFSDFLFAFQIQFYYSEFLESVAAIYQDLLSGKNPNTVIVPTSSSGQHRQRPALGEASMLEGVEASLFYQCLENLCDRHKYSCPPPALVKEVLSNVQRLTFYGFLVALSKHHGINQALGALPDKGDLMHDPAMDEELERLLAQVPGLVNSVTASSEASCLPSRTPPRVGSPWRPLHHARKVDAESDGSTEETDESET